MRISTNVKHFLLMFTHLTLNSNLILQNSLNIQNNGAKKINLTFKSREQKECLDTKDPIQRKRKSTQK